MALPGGACLWVCVRVDWRVIHNRSWGGSARGGSRRPARAPGTARAIVMSANDEKDEESCGRTLVQKTGERKEEYVLVRERERNVFVNGVSFQHRGSSISLPRLYTTPICPFASASCRPRPRPRGVDPYCSGAFCCACGPWCCGRRSRTLEGASVE